MTLHDRLVELIHSLNMQIDQDVQDHTPLITSGLFDSVALFNLVLWIEEQIGSTIDPTSFDLISEWNTVADIVAFIEQRR